MQIPTHADFIGTWVAKDNCKITLKEDSTCNVEKLNMGMLHGYIEKSVHDFTGKWNISLLNDELYIEIRSDSTESLMVYESFIVSGQGLLRNAPPWYFFQLIGDPDDFNEYRFIKLQ